MAASTRRSGKKGDGGSAGTPDPSTEQKITTQYLPCALTDEEVLVKVEEYKTARSEVDDLEAELKKVSSDLKKKIEDAEGKVAKVYAIMASRKEERPVECESVSDFQRKIVRLVRLDTKEVVSTRAMNESELQVLLTFPRGVEKKDGAATGGTGAEGGSSTS